MCLHLALSTAERAMSTNPAVTVLVVDDNAATLYATSHVLRSVGLSVLEATTGRDALLKARQGTDLVVLDINLPDMDGFQVCRELRAAPETRRTPVIYLSATFVDDIDKVHAVNAGADGYLTHPVEPPVLIATVNAFIRARRAEDAIWQSEAKFQAVFDNALHGIALLSEDLIFLDVNAAMARILGRDREAIVGRHMSAFSPKEQQLAGTAMAAALGSSKEWRGALPVLNAEGVQVDLEWSVSIHSVPNIRLAIVNDVTERKANDAERERLLASERLARAEAEQANRLKDDFLAALSHELRTPLSAIIGFAQVLLLYPIADTPTTRSQIQAIERNARVQAQLVSDLLDISRIAAGKLQLERQWFNPVDALKSALASIQNAATAQDVSIRHDLDTTVENIWWDPSRFQQVIWNLVDNAIKFSSPGKNVDVSLHQTASGIDLKVRDHGRGITPDFLPHVFDRFRQEDSGSRRWHGGLGLGLAVVYQIVAAHGSTITAESEGKDLGATFSLHIPRVATSHEPPPDAASAAPHANLHDVRVLLVEDNADTRALLKSVLVNASATVLDVTNVAKALASLAGFSPDVLVSDLGMAEQDGYDLIRQVRERGWSGELLPAIAVTAFARQEDRLRALAAGYQAHFPKPLELPAFLGEIRQLVDSRRR